MFDTPFDMHDDRQRLGVDDDAGIVSLEAAGIEPPAATETDEVPPSRRRWLYLALIAIVLAAAWTLLRGERAPAVAAPVPQVVVAAPLQREVTEWDEYIGRFEASRSVEVRPRVSGQITGVHFTDGQFVRAGQPLFTIDPRPYRASLAEAQARVASASSALALARSELARAERLVAEDAIAASEIDRLRAEVRVNEAALAATRATARLRALEILADD